MAVFCGCFLTDFLLLVAGVLFAINLYLTHRRNKWSQKGIPVIDPNPVFGNIKDVFFGRISMGEHIKSFYLRHKDKPFVTYYTLTKPLVMINDLELVKTVLIRDFNHFPDRNFTSSEADPLNYHNLFTISGQKWKNLRTKLSPTFTSGKLKRMFELIDACGRGLVDCLIEETSVNNVLDVKETAARYTSDSIASVGFGIDGNSLKDPKSEFRRLLRLTVTTNFIENFKNSLAFFFPEFCEKHNIVITKPEVTEFCRKLVWETVEMRQKKKIKRNDFLDLLIELKNKGRVQDDDHFEADEQRVEQSNEKIDLEGDKFVAQCFIFLVAGFETSAGSISYALYEMAMHPEIQDRLYEEITSVLEKHEGKLSYEAVQEMAYLNMVVMESSRKYPILPFLDRRVARGYRLPGTAIDLEVSQPVIIPVMGIHWDPDIYPEPHRFDPERFTEENKQKRPACTFLGFGEGPRICIGMRLGIMQVKIGLIHTLLNFTVYPAATTPASIIFNAMAPINQIKGELPLKFEKRANK